MIEATRKRRGAEIPEKTRIPCAVFEGTARPVEMVLAHKGTYRKLFNAPLNLCDKCNLMSSTELKARFSNTARRSRRVLAHPCRLARFRFEKRS